MKVNDWLKVSTEILDKAGIGTTRLDCLILLEDITSKDRSWLLAHPEFDIPGNQLKILNKQVEKRAKHQPLAYIRGKTEFYSRDFIINQDVLEPRPESETIIDLLKTLLHHKNSIYKEPPCKLVDVGTGSGALAITAKLELPESEVVATDIDPKCLAVAKKNAKKHGANIIFFQGDLLEPVYSLLSTPYTLLCNLPYVPDDFRINPAAMNEPKIAIFGGSDGLDLYRQLFAQIGKLSDKPALVFTESLPPQHENLARIAGNHGYKPVKSSDFIQVFQL